MDTYRQAVKEKPDVICIIGMHRSGTSMVAQLLNLCGMDLGPAEQLLGPNESNLLGHFEHKGFLEIDDALLAHFGGSWDDPANFKAGWEHDPSLEKYVLQAKELLQTFSGSACWGWKEPRTTILLPFWKSLVPNLRFVICVRSPLEVARSLEKRDRISIGVGAYLWNYYMRASIRDTEGCPRIFTFYEDYFEDDLSEIRKVAEFCQLQMPADLSSLRHAISSELKHHTSETSELLDTNDVRTEDKLFYIGLRALLFQGFVQTTSQHLREAPVSEYISRFLYLIEEFHDQEKLAQLQTTLVEKDQQVIKLQAEVQRMLRDEEQQIAKLQAMMQQEISRLEQENQKLQAFSGAVQKTLAYRIYQKFIKPLRSR